jgi:CTP:molybdopterin cytidylyltransferase MocA/HD superfamily phosphohydrolase YqeK
MNRFKPLLPLGEATVTDRVVATFSSLDVDVILVAGYRHHEIKAGIRRPGITIIYNPDYEKGMFSSLQAGVRRLKPAHRAFFVLPVDVPLVRPATIRRLTMVEDSSRGKIVYPVFRGRRGHPPLVPSGLAPAILGWATSGGLKAVLESHRDLALEAPVADSFVLFDIDTPEDYRELLERFRRYDIPTEEECREILETICRVAPDRVRHSWKVAEAAAAIAGALHSAGLDIDTGLVRAAAALHDIAKGRRRHDAAGGEMLRELGFGRVGDIVGVHSDLAGGDTGLPLESKVVYLADKLIEGERRVSLDERYSSANRRLGMTPEIEAAISERLKVARAVKQEIEALLGRPLEEIVTA